MALKNKLSLLCLSIIATNFGIDNVQSDDWNSYNYNRPFTPSNFATRNRNLYNNNRLFTPNNNLLVKGSLSPTKDDLYGERPIFSKLNDSDYDTDASDNEKNTGLKGTLRSYLNLYSNISEDSMKLQVNWNNNVLLGSNNISMLFTNYLLAESESTYEASVAKDSTVRQLQSMMDAGLVKDFMQVLNLYPALHKIPYEIPRLLYDNLIRFNVRFEKSQLNDIIDQYNNNYKNQIFGINNYLAENNFAHGNNSLYKHLSVLLHVLNNSSNTSSVVSGNVLDSILLLAEEFQDNIVIATLLNKFIESTSIKTQDKLIDKVIMQINQKGAATNNSTSCNYLYDIAIRLLLKKANYYNALMRTSKEYKKISQLQLFQSFKNLSSVVQQIKNVQYEQYDNITNLLVNKYAEILKNIIQVNRDNYSTGFDLDSPVPSYIFLLHQICNSGQNSQQSSYNQRLKEFILSSRMQDLSNMVLANWCYYNGIDSIPLSNVDAQQDIIKAPNVINLVNILLANARSKDNVVAQQASDIINKIRQYVNKNDRIISNSNELLYDTMTYALCEQEAYNAWVQLLGRFGLGKKVVSYHTQSKNNILVPNTNGSVFDVSWLINNPARLDNTVHIPKNIWDELFRKYLGIASGRFMQLNDNASRNIDRQKHVWNVINNIFMNNQQNRKRDYILGEKEIIQVFEKLTTELVQSNDAYSNVYKQIIQQFIKNVPVRVRNAALCDYIQQFITYPQDVDIKFIMNALKDHVQYVNDHYYSVLTSFLDGVVDQMVFKSPQNQQNNPNFHAQCKSKLSNIPIDPKQNLVPVLIHAYHTSNNQFQDIEINRCQDTAAEQSRQQRIKFNAPYLIYDMSFNWNKDVVNSLYAAIYNMIRTRPDMTSFHLDPLLADGIKEYLQKECLNKLQCKNNLAFVASGGASSSKIYKKDQWPLLDKETYNVDSKQLLLQVVDKSIFLENVVSLLMMGNNQYYRTIFKGAYKNLSEIYRRYFANNNNISIHNIAKDAISMLINGFGQFLSFVGYFDEKGKMQAAIKWLSENQSVVSRILENTLNNPSASNSHMKMQLKSSIIYTWFIIEQIMSKDSIDDTYLLSKTDLDIATQKKTMFIKGFYSITTGMNIGQNDIIQKVVNNLEALYTTQNFSVNDEEESVYSYDNEIND